MFLGTFSSTDPGLFVGLAQQAGASWWEIDGERWRVAIDTEPTRRVAEYWGGLVEEGVIAAEPMYTPQWNAALNAGTQVGWVSAAWAPGVLAGNAGSTAGLWRMATIPQWDAGHAATGNWGGSTLAVVAGTPHAKQAAEFVKWFGGSAASWKILSGPVAGAFPAYTPLLNDSTFQARTLKITGATKPNEVFASAAQNMVNPEWPPIMTAALTQSTSTFAGVTKGTETLPQAFRTYQSQMVAYAKAQGFTVTTS